MRRRALWVALLGLLLWSSPVVAQSLWSTDASNLYAPERAHKVGDLLTLIIVEKAEASQGAKTTTGHDSSVSAGPGVGALAGVIPQIKMDNNNKMAAGGTTTRDGSLNAKMTVRVVEVLPNGNLVIEGREEMRLNDEVEIITVTGVCRPQDVSVMNTIESTYVADAKITYSGQGSLGETQHVGLLTKILSWLF